MPPSRKPAKPKSTRKPKAHPPRKITLKKKPTTIQAARYGVPEVVIMRIANADGGGDGSDIEEEEGYGEQADKEVVDIKKEKTQGSQSPKPKPKSPIKHRRAADLDDSDSDSDICIVVEVKKLKKVEEEASSEKKMTKARNININPDAEALQRRNSHHPTVVPPKVFYADSIISSLIVRIERNATVTGIRTGITPARMPLPKGLSHLPSVLIGLTLAVDEGFNVLFVVIVFHRIFLARYNYIPVLAAIIYGLSTTGGHCSRLALCSSYNPGSATASIVSCDVLDSLSTGILIYTGLVEGTPLLAHEFLFNKEMVNSSNGKTCVRHWGDAPGLRADVPPRQIGIGVACVVG
ncbi:hypothetical protein B0H14DRAFT_3462093 [Mycena olivaceomarginata]|nr:hypothetical protein B0H14DRAFT_3462093 [Mycena olivaceomarginata]